MPRLSVLRSQACLTFFMNPQLTRRHSPTHEQLQLAQLETLELSVRGETETGAITTEISLLTVSVRLVGQLFNLIDAQRRKEVERRRLYCRFRRCSASRVSTLLWGGILGEVCSAAKN